MKPLPPDEVARRVKEWLAVDSNLDSLKAVFDKADRLAKELTERTRFPAKKEQTNE